MTMGTKHEILEEFKAQYFKATKGEKSKILDHLEAVTKLKRKSIIKRFRLLQLRRSFRQDGRGRPEYYGPDVTAALKEIWEISRGLCAERLKPIIREYVGILISAHDWHHSEETTGKLLSMSLGSLKGRTARFDRVKAGGGRSTTKPSDLKEIIPIRRGPWDNPPPGKGEIDTVAHCGGALAGNFAYTVQYTDVSTIWTLLGAQMNKGQEATKITVASMRERLPFPLSGLDPDTGSEFVNWHMKEWCDEQCIELTRIRPYHKNDHGRIEQKNYTNVRKLTGYIRIDTAARLRVLQKLYAVYEDFVNHFLPSQKCLEKQRVGARYRKRYDAPQTAYRRVLAHADIAQEIKAQLQRKHETLNPKVLQQKIDRLRAELFREAKM
jgi:hypothetical protein